MCGTHINSVECSNEGRGSSSKFMVRHDKLVEKVKIM